MAGFHDIQPENPKTASNMRFWQKAPAWCYLSLKNPLPPPTPPLLVKYGSGRKTN